MKGIFRAVRAALSPAAKKDPEQSVPEPRRAPRRFVETDANGAPLHFYSDDVHAVIPKVAVEITEAQYRTWHEGQGLNPMKRYRLVSGALVDHEPPPPRE